MADAYTRRAGSHWRIDRNPGQITSIGLHYSRFVGIMKVVLPATAVVILALIALWPSARELPGQFKVDYSDLNLKHETKTMANAKFVSTSSRDEPYTITADSVTQHNRDPDLVDLESPQADINRADGTHAVLNAEQGRYHMVRRTLALEGNIEMHADSGHHVYATKIDFDLMNGTGNSDLPVAGNGPLGKLRAQKFSASDQFSRLYFHGGVKVTIYPGKEAEK